MKIFLLITFEVIQLDSFLLLHIDDVRVRVLPLLPDVLLGDEVGHEGADVRPRRRPRVEDAVLQRGVHPELAPLLGGVDQVARTHRAEVHVVVPPTGNLVGTEFGKTIRQRSQPNLTQPNLT